jgi:ABC-type uncharacterized transport system involved in gliding motility auxiliary subunit
MTPARRAYAWGAIAFAAVLFVALNVLSQNVLRGVRLDLTEDELYTLSDGTRSVLANMTEPLTVRFFFSKGLANDVPTIGQYARRVQELLETYAGESNGRITLQVIEPEPFSEVEDEAVAFGLQGVPINAAGDRLYFGMAATNTTDDIETVAFFQDQREAFLEYDLTRAFYNLANPTRKVVGLISTLPVAGGIDPQTRSFQRPWVIAEQIRQLFELRDLGLQVSSVPEDVDVLMVVHPKDLTVGTRYAIDQYVLGGGRAMVFVDPHSEVSAGVPDPSNPVPLHNSNLPELFEAWGVKLAPGMVVADRLTARRVRTGPPDRPVPVDYVAWLALDQRGFNPDEAATSQLGIVNLATAGALSQSEAATTDFVPLLTSSPVSMLIERLYVQFVPNPQQLLADFAPTGEQYVMAARISGPARSSFADGRPGDVVDTGAEHIAESDGPINLIVVTDSDLIADRTWVQVQQFLGRTFALPSADNGAFVINALDVLSGSIELISLRSRGISFRPFEVVEELQRQAEDQFRETEQELQARLSETEEKLAELQAGEGAGGALVLTPEQRQAIAEFRQELVATRKELRNVQLALRRDIEGLGAVLKFLNVALAPLVIGVVAVVVVLVRRRRRRRAHGLA